MCLVPEILVNIGQPVASPTLEFDQHSHLGRLLVNYHSLAPENPTKHNHFIKSTQCRDFFHRLTLAN